jgi:hypothetical protein
MFPELVRFQGKVFPAFFPTKIADELGCVLREMFVQLVAQGSGVLTLMAVVPHLQ